jgi:hypothetical protein
LLWLPSQNGGFFECLQPHQATVFDSVISIFLGPKLVPLCEPSQKGCVFERPHEHHQYAIGSAFNTNGDFCAMTGSFIDWLCPEVE